jgi:hypothetical protein
MFYSGPRKPGGSEIKWDISAAGLCCNINLLGDNIGTVKRYIETLIDASKEVGLEVNVEKTKYMLLSRHQNAGHNHDTYIANRSYENVAQFKYFGMTVHIKI